MTYQAIVKKQLTKFTALYTVLVFLMDEWREREPRAWDAARDVLDKASQ